MSQTHLIRNQLGHWWGRGKRWVDGRDTAKVAHWRHHDEVANTLFELSSQDVDLRGEIIVIDLAEDRLPALEISSVPLPDEEANEELPLENTVTDHNTSPESQVNMEH